MKLFTLRRRYKSFLFGDEVERNLGILRRIAGIRIAGLIVQRGLDEMVAGLRRDVGAQDEFAGVHAELVIGAECGRVVGSWWKIHARNIHTSRLSYQQLRWNKALGGWRVGIDVQPVV